MCAAVPGSGLPAHGTVGLLVCEWGMVGGVRLDFLNFSTEVIFFFSHPFPLLSKYRSIWRSVMH